MAHVIGTLATFGRWTALGLGTSAVMFLIAMLVGEGPPQVSTLTVREQSMFAALLAVVAGFILAWRWEGYGGLLTIAATLAFAALDNDYNSAPVRIAGLIGCLHVACALVLRRYPHSAGTNVSRAFWIVAGVLGLLTANEVFGNPPLFVGGLQPQVALTGDWHDAGLAMTIRPDATVSGTVSGHAISKGKSETNRSWFGKLMNWRTDYRIGGEFGGRHFSVLVNRRDSAFEGSLFSGKQARRKLRLTRPV
jgi:hypothetical protein